MIRIETVHSFWMINEDERVYMRMPKTESPRPLDEQNDRESMSDLVWHPYHRWLVVEDPCRGRLVIHLSERIGDAIVAPLPEPIAR